MRKTLLFFSLVVLISNSGCSSATSANSINRSTPNINNMSSINLYRGQMLSYVNQIRTRGASCAGPTTPLGWNRLLENAAKSHTNDMAESGIVSHAGSGTSYDPAKKAIGIGSTFIDRIEYFGYPIKKGQLVGENLNRTAIKITKSDKPMPNFKRAIQNLINDEPHCRIIMNPRFKDIGMYIVRKGKYYYFSMELGER